MPPRAGLAQTEDSTLARNASFYLVNSASKGDPNSSDLVSWPKIDQNQPQTMALGVCLGPMPLAYQFSGPVITNQQEYAGLSGLEGLAVGSAQPP